MSLYGAYNNGVSGLLAYSDAMSTVSQNLANMRTVGYRRTEANFATVLGGTKFENESTGGVRFSPQPVITQQGAIEVTGRPFDLAISGEGMFVFGTEPTVGGGGKLLYSRAGQLEGIAPEGGSTTAYYGNASGLYLMGWPTDASGVPVSTDAGALVPLVASEATPPTDVGRPTTLGTLTAVLPATGTTATTMVNFFNTNGDEQSFALNFTKTGANAWTMTGTVPGGGAFSHNLTFDGDGALTSASTVDLAGAFTLDIASLVQRGTAFEKIDYQNDGLGQGQFVRYEVDKTGLVSGVFTSGAVRSLFRVAIADFANANALDEHADNLYTSNAKSGEAMLRAATVDRTSLIPGAVETSNVDLADTFTKMVVTQRAYDSSAQVVRTVDEMTQTLRDLKR